MDQQNLLANVALGWFSGLNNYLMNQPVLYIFIMLSPGALILIIFFHLLMSHYAELGGTM